jgi:hypothetical protein
VGGTPPSHFTAPGAGTTPFTFNGNTNSGRSSSFPKDAGKSPVAVTAAGWYTFEHIFYDNGGSLAVDLKLLDPSDNLVSTWTLNNPADLMSSVVGGNRYGWVSANEFSTLAIDNSTLTVVPEPTGIALLALSAGALLLRRQRRGA